MNRPQPQTGSTTMTAPSDLLAPSSVRAAKPPVALPMRQATAGMGGAFGKHLVIIGLPIATAAAVLVLWEAAVRALKISPVILPAPSQVYFKVLAVFPLLFSNAVQTGGEAVLGLVLAAVVGLALGAGLAYSKYFRAAIYPNLVFFQLIPKVALAPLFVIWLGIGIESRLTFTIFITFFPIAISTAVGLASVDPIYIRFGRGLTASDWQIFTHVRVPFALPAIFGGLKIGVTMAFIGVIVGEFITSQSGLGYLILFAMARTETTVVVGAIAFLCIIGIAVYGAVALLEIVTRRIWGAPYGDG
jgi:NitT/TauT family transport system permease protein